jgi:uncharacterized membrane protein
MIELLILMAILAIGFFGLISVIVFLAAFMLERELDQFDKEN